MNVEDDGWYEMNIVDAAEVEDLLAVERRTPKYLPIFTQLNKLGAGKALRIETSTAEEMRHIRDAVNGWSRKTGRKIQRRRRENVLYVIVDAFQKDGKADDDAG